MEADCGDFVELYSEMEEFYALNAYSGELGEISQQIYQEFTCYKFKSDADLRKIFFHIDKLHLCPQPTTVHLSIYQSAQKLYEHEFKGSPSLFDNLEHEIELQLFQLEELLLVCNTENK